VSEHDSNMGEAAVETGQGSAGEPQELDPETAAERADHLELLSEEALDELQEKLQPTRRRSGPELQTETEARDESEDVPDVEPTETEEGSETEEGLETT
jgi:hypothetical protein